ncbi:MAG: hypothetical protein ACTSQF_06760 [Candidatus Heimdallarchaeaceae archaeon]
MGFDITKIFKWIKNLFKRMINGIKNAFVRMYKNTKEGLKPKNIKASILEMPRMNQVYWSKLLVGFTAGLIFGLTNFTNWLPGVILLIIYIGISLAWFLTFRKIETGIKTRQYFTSAVFQYFISAVAIWTLIWNIIYVPESFFIYPIS